MQNEYDDIIELPHHISSTHPPMSAHDRAAQFAPFAALTGYEAQLGETERLTEERAETDEYRAARLDACMRLLVENAEERPTVSVTYFKADERKSGGAYVTVSGSFRRIDDDDGTIVFTDGKRVPIGDIYAVEGDIFCMLEENI